MKSTMKLYIMTDMEGVAGVVNAADYLSPDARWHEEACELTTRETNAAIEGALAAGVEEILVADGHGHGAIEPTLLHPRAKLLTGRPVGYPFGCDASFDFAFIIGQHAKSNADGGHLSHNGSFEVEDETINGLSVGELAKNMLFCAYFNVPTILVSGDAACVQEAHALVPEMETATVKWGVKSGSATGKTEKENELFNGGAIHLSPEAARDVIRESAERAIQRRQEIPRFWIEPPYQRHLEMRPTASSPAQQGDGHYDDLLAMLQTWPPMQPVAA